VNHKAAHMNHHARCQAFQTLSLPTVKRKNVWHHSVRTERCCPDRKITRNQKKRKKIPIMLATLSMIMEMVTDMATDIVTAMVVMVVMVALIMLAITDVSDVMTKLQTIASHNQMEPSTLTRQEIIWSSFTVATHLYSIQLTIAMRMELLLKMSPIMRVQELAELVQKTTVLNEVVATKVKIITTTIRTTIKNTTMYTMDLAHV